MTETLIRYGMPIPDEFKILRSALIGDDPKADGKAIKRFSDEVNEHLRQGWEVHGPLVSVMVQNPQTGHVLYQPMLKHGERG